MPHGGHEIHPKTFQVLPPKRPKRHLRGAQEHLGPSQESPKSLPKPPLERSSGTLWRHKALLVGVGSLWPSFWSPRGLLYLILYTCSTLSSRFSSLLNSLFSVSYLFSFVPFIVSSLSSPLSSLCSLLSSLFALRSSVYPAARTTSFSCSLSLTMFENSFPNSKHTVSIFRGAAGMRAALEYI